MAVLRKFLAGSAASVTALVVASGAALASGPVVYSQPEVMVAPMPAPTYSFAGFYGGLSFSSVGGGINENSAIPAQRPDLVRDTGVGAFAGYNWQSGNFVFGGELAYTNFSTPYVGFPTSIQENALELRARAGYAFNRVMVYGFVGGARSSLDNGGTQFTQTGMTYGLGIEAFVTQSMTLGLEVARRDVSDTQGGLTLGTDIDTVALRAAFHF